MSFTFGTVDSKHLLAKFKARSIIIVALFFSLTTPAGIAIGIGIYPTLTTRASSRALIIEGVFNAASAGSLVYMALVDLLVADFMSTKVQGNGRLRLQLLCNCFLLFGAGSGPLLPETWRRTMVPRTTGRKGGFIDRGRRSRCGCGCGSGDEGSERLSRGESEVNFMTRGR